MKRLYVYYFLFILTEMNIHATVLREDHGSKQKHEEAESSNSADNDHNDVKTTESYVGVGFYAVNQQMLCQENRHFTGVKTKINSTPAGVSVIFGCNLSNNFGIEIGCDAGRNNPRQTIGNVYASNSPIFMKMVSDVNRFFSAIGANINAAVVDYHQSNAGGGLADTVVDRAVTIKLVDVFKYIGGDETVVLDHGFITNPAVSLAGGVTSTNIWNAAPIATATLNDFTYGADVGFGGSNTETIEFLRKFITSYYPNFASVLQSLTYPQLVDLRADAATSLGELLRGSIRGHVIQIAGGLPDVTPTPIDEVIAARRELLEGLSKEIDSAAENGKLAFGLSPHIALKYRVYAPSIKSDLFAKFGFSYFRGIARWGEFMEQKPLAATTPFIGIGMEKRTNDNWILSISTTYYFPIVKNYGPITILGHTTRPKVKIKRTMFQVMAIIPLS
ncbi:MAG: hypothetical protein LBB25_03425 [Holosporaceae bacterium]|jgi:hypothetical protein|nr:hypothetical protein [Holosporaceae bacterium]